MFNWLLSILEAQLSIELVKEALRAMILWMKMISIFDRKDLASVLEILVNLCTDSIRLGDYNLCELCVELISGIICDPSAHHHPLSVLLILDKILPLQSMLDAILDLNDMVRVLAIFFYLTYSTNFDTVTALLGNGRFILRYVCGFS